LDRLIRAVPDLWRGKSAITEAIFLKYCQLTEEGQSMPKFSDGTGFLDDFLGSPPVSPQPQNRQDPPWQLSEFSGDTLNDSYEDRVLEELMDGRDWLTPEEFDGHFGAGSADQVPTTSREDLDRFFTIGVQEDQHVKKFRTTATARTVRFHNLDEVDNVEELMGRLFEVLLKRVFADADADDLVGVCIDHPGLDVPINVPFKRKRDLNSEQIMRMIMLVMESNRNFSLDDSLVCRFVWVAQQKAGVRNRKIRINWDQWKDWKRCFVKIENKGDNLCCAR
jgi:hypothetical protein